MTPKDLSLIVIRCCLIFPLIQGHVTHKHQHKQTGKTHSKEQHKNVPRSALIAIRPEDLLPHNGPSKDVSGSKKSYGQSINLPSMEDMQKSNGDLTPSVVRKVALIGNYQPANDARYQTTSRVTSLQNNRVSNLQGIGSNPAGVAPQKISKIFLIKDFQPVNNLYRTTSRVTNPQNNRANNLQAAVVPQQNLDSVHPTLSANPSPLGFKVGGKSVFLNTNPDVGEANSKYNSDPMPEYNYKDSKYDLPTTYDDRYNYDDFGDKDFHDDNSHGNSFHDDNYDYSKGNDNDESDQDDSKTDIGPLVGKKGQSLINEIGRKVLLNILQNQNDGNSNSPTSDTNDSPQVPEDQTNLDKLAKLFLSPKISNPANQKIAQILEHLSLANTIKTRHQDPGDVRVTQEAQLPAENDLNNLHVPNDQGKISIGGKLNNVIGLAKATPTSKTVVMTTPSTEEPGDLNMLQNDLPENFNDGDVVLRISGKGKPVSFKADTSTDGSLLLKIPKKYSEDLLRPSGDLATESQQSTNDQSEAFNQNVLKLLGKELQISDLALTGKQNKESRYINTPDPVPTRKLTLPSLSSLRKYKTPTVIKPEPKHLLSRNLDLPPQDSSPSVDGLTAQQLLSNLGNSPLVKSVFPGLAGLPPSAQNIQSLMTLLTRIDQQPSSYVAGSVSKFTGSLPVNDAMNTAGGTLAPSKSYSMKGVLKASQLAEDSAVTRNKGTAKEDNEWSPCTVTCGEGLQARATPCQEKFCSGYTTETRPCDAGPCPEQLARAGLKLHNKFRVWHRSPALKWSASLAKKAGKLADDLAEDKDPSMVSAEMKELPGENIAVILAQDYNTAAETATRQWYGEVKWYNFQHPSMTDETRHFTQVVWRSTRRAGIGIAKSKINQNVIVVALYDPPGNIESQGLKKNVRMPDTTLT